MSGREIIKEVMKETNNTNAELAGKLGISQAALWDRLNNKKVKTDIATSIMVEMLRVMGYKVMIVPRKTKLPEGGFEVE